MATMADIYINLIVPSDFGVKTLRYDPQIKTDIWENIQYQDILIFKNYWNVQNLLISFGCHGNMWCGVQHGTTQNGLWEI